MPFSREMDASGLLLCRYQAELFDASLRLEIGSRDFIKRFVYSEACFELDSLGIMTKPMHVDQFIDEMRLQIKPNSGPKWREEELHWAGYMYRYWCYVDAIPMKRIYRVMSPEAIRRFYPLYHGLDPLRVIEIWKNDFLPPNNDAALYDLYRKTVNKTKFKKL